MHKNNRHRDNYDFDELTQKLEALKPFVFVNAYNTQTIDFANPTAVKTLNKALLFAQYDIRFWDFPDENLCPPIPNRADYIHHLSDLLYGSNINTNVKILDVGTGATVIYPILGNAIYKWTFVATDIEAKSLHTAQNSIDKNNLNDAIELRYQKDETHLLKNIIHPTDKFSASMCNPPFFKSEEEALEATKMKLKGLGKQSDNIVRNFSGTSKELSYKGGEKAFLHTYLYESTQFKKQCFWFTSLVSNISLVKSIQASFGKLGVTESQVIEMIQGNKVSRVLAWTFLTKAEQEEWNK